MKSERDFPCWVLDVLSWENSKGEIAGISCVPWVYRSTREPRIILRRRLSGVNKTESVVAQLFAPYSTGVSVVIRAEEEEG
jgi:hypothetical protein